MYIQKSPTHILSLFKELSNDNETPSFKINVAIGYNSTYVTLRIYINDKFHQIIDYAIFDEANEKTDVLADILACNLHNYLKSYNIKQKGEI